MGSRTQEMRTGLTVEAVTAIMAQVQAGEEVSSDRLLMALIGSKELSADAFDRAKAALDEGETMAQAYGFLRVAADHALNREREAAGIN